MTQISDSTRYPYHGDTYHLPGGRTRFGQPHPACSAAPLCSHVTRPAIERLGLKPCVACFSEFSESEAQHDAKLDAYHEQEA